MDGDASLAGLLAYLQAESEQGAGLEQAVPSDREAVKLLTVHKAKGLEWEAVFLPALMQGVFPSDRVTDNWVTTRPCCRPTCGGRRRRSRSSPRPPTLAWGSTSPADRQQLLAEDRLAYVAVHSGQATAGGFGPFLAFRSAIGLGRPRRTCERSRSGPSGTTSYWPRPAPPGTENPLVVDGGAAPVAPAPGSRRALARRQEAAAGGGEGPAAVHADPGGYDGPETCQLLLDDHESSAGWDADLDRLLTEARSSTVW